MNRERYWRPLRPWEREWKPKPKLAVLVLSAATQTVIGKTDIYRITAEVEQVFAMGAAAP